MKITKLNISKRRKINISKISIDSNNLYGKESGYALIERGMNGNFIRYKLPNTDWFNWDLLE